MLAHLVFATTAPEIGLMEGRQPEAASTRPPANDADGALVARARRDPSAFEPLFFRYWAALVRTPGDFIPSCILHGDAQGNRMALKLKVSPA
jgi:hypothetical protein